MMNWEFQAARVATTLRAESKMEATYKKARIIWIALLGAAVLYCYIPEQLHTSEHPISNLYVIVIALLVVWCLFGIRYFRRTLVEVSEVALRVDRNDAKAARKWMVGQLGTLACAQAVVLYGLVLRFAGANRILAYSLYTIGILGLIVLRPKRIE